MRRNCGYEFATAQWRLRCAAAQRRLRVRRGAMAVAPAKRRSRGFAAQRRICDYAFEAAQFRFPLRGRTLVRAQVRQRPRTRPWTCLSGTSCELRADTAGPCREGAGRLRPRLRLCLLVSVGGPPPTNTSRAHARTARARAA